MMNSRPVKSAIRSAPDPTRAENGFRLIPRAAVVADSEQARILAALFSGSMAMTALLSKHPDWIQSVLDPDRLRHPRREQGLQRDVESLTAEGGDGSLARLREFRQREMLRIAARDLAGLGATPQIIREISNVADACLDATLRLCWKPLRERLGRPYHPDADGRWQPTEFCVLGLGKLGGQELNYSSDVDVMFVYSEEGHVFKTAPRTKTVSQSAMSSHSYFKRLAESFVAEVTRATADGALYRVDVRLRPEGDAGPLVRSLPGYENFYAQWGQTWERMMLIKARPVAGDAGLGAEFLEMVQPFRYPRALGEGTVREIATMKARLESDVVRAGELDRDVKRGRGGIREIEFIVQAAQLLHAGRIPFLQGAQTLPALEKLAQYRLLTAAAAQKLADAYCFLRAAEHRLQMENNLQTHTLPADAKSRAWLAAMMGFTRRSKFEGALKAHTAFVRRTYEKSILAGDAAPASPFPDRFKGAEAQWKQILEAHSFRDPERAFKLLEEFAHGPAYAHTSQRTTELAMKLVPRILAACPNKSRTGVPPVPPQRDKPGNFDNEGRRDACPSLSDPDRVLARMDSFISAYGARATLVETWTHNPQIFDLLLLLFDRSEFLAEIAIRTPDLVDDLVLSGRLRRSKSAEEILKELRHGAKDADQRLWLRRYHQAEFMRIGLRDILGLADYEQNFIELSALADACLQYSLEAVGRTQRIRTPPISIIGLGKLGGEELNYGSDLDILFVAANDAKKDLPRLQKLAAGVLEMLSSPTELGTAFVTDARLRPDGEKGLLINTLAAHEEYYRARAQLWEIQALTRTRAVAGNAALGAAFQQLAAQVTDLQRTLVQPVQLPLRSREAASSGDLRLPACVGPDWPKEIARMRERIEKERTPPGQDALAFKTGKGGLMDAEFIAQGICLGAGWQEPNTLRALERVKEAKFLPGTQAEQLIENYRRLRGMESILRRWSFEGEDVLPLDAAPFYRVSVRCGFASPETFRDAVATWRKKIREIYGAVFSG